MEVTIDERLDLKVGFLQLEGCAIGPSDERLGAELESIMDHVTATQDLPSLSSHPVVRGVRGLFKSAGMDPSRYRPSSEALLRRVLKGQGLTRINAIVDINNACSLGSCLPVGSYDRARLGAHVHVRIGEPGEAYAGIARVFDANGKLVAADEQGPFGSPIADSERSLVRVTTHEVLVLVYAPPDVADAAIESVLADYDELARRHAGARLVRSGVVA